MPSYDGHSRSASRGATPQRRSARSQQGVRGSHARQASDSSAQGRSQAVYGAGPSGRADANLVSHRSQGSSAESSPRTASRRPSFADDAPRPSRDSLVRAYDAASASKARSARMRSQDAMRERAKRPPRQPLTSQESHDQIEMSREAYERARASRDPRSAARPLRGGDREVIDGRGSIDSRAFNERNVLVGYTVDSRDQHEPAIDHPEGRSRWRSQPGYGAHGVTGRHPGSRGTDLRSLSDTISGRSDYQGQRSREALPLSIKLLGALIVILLVILIILLIL